MFKARSGHSRVLVLCGEPGIGKTALLDDLVAHAAGVSVIRMPGVQSEMELAYGALHGLWSQLAEEDVERLPGPQRVALRVTFGLEAGVPPSPLLVGLAMLSGLADLAERQPLLVVVDDAQWLDQASARTLAFVARRLRAEGVGIVFAVRESIEPLRGLPELLIPGLDGDAARGVLASVRRTAVDERILERFIAETGGNPLALLELSQGLTADDPGGSGGLREADSGGVWVVLEESFHRRVEALDADAGTLLLIAAAEPLGDPPLLWRAADLAGVPRHAAMSWRKPGCCTSAPRSCSDIRWSGPRPTGWHPRARDAARIAHLRRRRTRRPIPTVELGTELLRHPDLMRRPRRSWSARPIAHRRVAVWPRRLRSDSARWR